MSSFKSNEIVFAQKSFFTNMPIVSMRDDMVMKLFDEPVESVFYLGYRQDNTHPLLANIIEFFTQ